MPIGPERLGPARVGAVGSPGQSLADLTTLLALACDAPAAVLAVVQSNRTWRPIGFGFDSQEGLDDQRLYDLLAGSEEPVEIANMLTGRLAGSPLAQEPHLMRWSYGRCLRDGLGPIVAVVVIFDRRLRRATRREREAMAAGARRLVEAFAQLPRPPEPRPISDVTVHSSPRPAGSTQQDQHGFMLAAEVAQAFDVTHRTVINWAATGKLPSVRTLGGHLRFRRDEILKLLG